MADDRAYYDRVGPQDIDVLGHLLASANVRDAQSLVPQLHQDLTSGDFKLGQNWKASIDGELDRRVQESAPAPAAIDRTGNSAPLCWPVAWGAERVGAVNSPFGVREAPKAGASTRHNGVDFRAPLNTEIRSPQAGRIMLAGVRGKGGSTIVVRYDDGSIGGFAHTAATQGLKVGDRVGACQVIGSSDGSGNSTGPHLHYTYRPGEAQHPATLATKTVDPMTTQFLPLDANPGNKRAR